MMGEAGSKEEQREREAFTSNVVGRDAAPIL
jgi:hypothetical protein